MSTLKIREVYFSGFYFCTGEGDEDRSPTEKAARVYVYVNGEHPLLGISYFHIGTLFIKTSELCRLDEPSGEGQDVFDW